MTNRWRRGSKDCCLLRSGRKRKLTRENWKRVYSRTTPGEARRASESIKPAARRLKGASIRPMNLTYYSTHSVQNPKFTYYSLPCPSPTHPSHHLWLLDHLSRPGAKKNWVGFAPQRRLALMESSLCFFPAMCCAPTNFQHVSAFGEGLCVVENVLIGPCIEVGTPQCPHCLQVRVIIIF